MMYIWLIPVVVVLVVLVAIFYKTATKEEPDRKAGVDRADMVHPEGEERHIS